MIEQSQSDWNGVGGWISLTIKHRSSACYLSLHWINWNWDVLLDWLTAEKSTKRSTEKGGTRSSFDAALSSSIRHEMNQLRGPLIIKKEKKNRVRWTWLMMRMKRDASDRKRRPRQTYRQRCFTFDLDCHSFLLPNSLIRLQRRGDVVRRRFNVNQSPTDCSYASSSSSSSSDQTTINSATI